jgi:BMFP domain-containing protein YqiC
VSDFIWETFDGLFKTMNRQDKRVGELEARIVELENRLNERSLTAAPTQSSQNALQRTHINELPAERAA